MRKEILASFDVPTVDKEPLFNPYICETYLPHCGDQGSVNVYVGKGFRLLGLSSFDLPSVTDVNHDVFLTKPAPAPYKRSLSPEYYEISTTAFRYRINPLAYPLMC